MSNNGVPLKSRLWGHNSAMYIYIYIYIYLCIAGIYRTETICLPLTVMSVLHSLLQIELRKKAITLRSFKVIGICPNIEQRPAGRDRVHRTSWKGLLVLYTMDYAWSCDRERDFCMNLTGLYTELATKDVTLVSRFNCSSATAMSFGATQLSWASYCSSCTALSVRESI